jgi:Uma2 family endonuclease
LPDGSIELPPDWVSEIISPGHEKNDTVRIPLLLRRHRVPWYWIIAPEERTLIVHALDDGNWRVVATLTDWDRARVPPFEAVDLDLGAMVGGN